MLWDASAINGYAIEESDGQLGTVSTGEHRSTRTGEQKRKVAEVLRH